MRCLDEAANIDVGPQIGGLALLASAKDVASRNLRRRIDGLQIPGEPPDCTEPMRPMQWLYSLRLAGPRDRQFGRERLGTGGFDEVDELGKRLARVLELEAERSPKPQVLLQVGGELGHGASTGQGCARFRKASMSTRA
ncbi:MAG: hypothetical protein ACLPXU_16580 [Acidimicrobiales bacterium]